MEAKTNIGDNDYATKSCGRYYSLMTYVQYRILRLGVLIAGLSSFQGIVAGAWRGRPAMARKRRGLREAMAAIAYPRLQSGVLHAEEIGKHLRAEGKFACMIIRDGGDAGRKTTAGDEKYFSVDASNMPWRA